MFEFRAEDVIYIHDQIVQATGGLGGLRDAGQLQACLARPKQSAFGEEVYGDLFEKAAALLDSIANTHPFVDGNKRTAMAIATLYLLAYGVKIDFSNEEYIKFMLHVVNDKPEIAEVRDWLRQHGDIIL